MSESDDFRSLIGRLEDLSCNQMIDHPNCSTLDVIIDELQSLTCRVYGHEWIPDQCGYWQHQMCVHCHESKYPDMAVKSCQKLDEEMCGMTEQDWLSGVTND